MLPDEIEQIIQEFEAEDALVDSDCVQNFARLCRLATAQGWHEANGGNLSCLLDDSFSANDAPSAHDGLSAGAGFNPARSAGNWQALIHPVPLLAGRFTLMTASGAYLSNVPRDLAGNAGIIELNEDGSAWRPVWGFENGARPSSELETHLAAFEVGMRAGDDACRVIYHAHCPHVIALSAVLEPNSRAWTRVLWKIMTETIVVFPQGIGVVPWMVPGSSELAQATIELMGTYKVCVWVNHGIMTRAASFDEAFGQIETIEKAAAIYLRARAASGGAEPCNLVTDDQLCAICNRYGITVNQEFLD